MRTKRFLTLLIFLHVSLFGFSQLIAPTVWGTTPTNNAKPTWNWSSGGGDGVGVFQFGYDEIMWFPEEAVTSFTPSGNLSEGEHTLFVQERDASSNWSASGSFTITIDLTPPATPTVNALTTNSTSPTVTGTATVGAGEALTVTVNSVTYTVGDGNLSLSGTDWTLVIPVGNALGEGTYEVAATVTDAATNSATDATSNELVVDLTPPAAPTVNALTTNSTTPTVTGTATVGAGETLTVTVNSVTYTEGDGNLSLSGTDWTLVIPGGDALTGGTYEVEATVTDAATNSSTDITSNELVIDEGNPTVILSTLVGATTNLSPFEITIVFSEAVQYFIASDISVTNGTPSNLQTSDNITFTADITPGGEGAVTMIVNAGACEDLAGNGNDISNELLVEYYTADPPTLNLVEIYSSNADPTKAKVDDKITLDFSSTRKLQNVIVTIAGNIVTPTTANQKSWTAEYTMTLAEPEGEVEFLIEFEDQNGVEGINVNTTTNSSMVNFKKPPAAPIVTGDTPTNIVQPTWNWDTGGGGNGTFRYKFNDPNLEVGAIVTTSKTYTHGSNLSHGNSYTLYVQETDDYGNWSLSGSHAIVIDTQTDAPTLLLPEENKSSGSHITVKFTIPEKAKNETVKMIFVDDNTDFSDRVVVFMPVFEEAGTHEAIINGEDLLDNSLNAFPVVFDATGGSYGIKLFSGHSYTVTIEYEDSLGNAKSSDTHSGFNYGKPAPLFENIAVNPRPNALVDDVHLTFSWRVLVSEVVYTAFTLTRNGETVDLSGIPAITYDDVNYSPPVTAKHFYLNLSGLTGDEGTYMLTVREGICDRFGACSEGDSTLTWVCDKTPPTLSYSSSVSSPTNSPSFNVTALVSEATNDFEWSDIVATNADVDNFIINSPTSYTFTVSNPNEGLITLNVPVGTYSDLATNPNTAASQLNIVYDGTVPQPVISSSVGSPTNATSIPITIDFGETVSGFEQGDINISGGLITGFSTINNKVFTFNLDVAAEATYTVNIAAGVCADMAGNSNAMATEFSIEYDNSEPTLNPVTITSNQTPNNLVRIGKKANLSFTALEEIENVQVSIHGNPVVANSGDGLVWSASYTFTDDDDPEGTVTFTIDFDDLAGNTGVQVTELNFGGTNLTFDKTPPQFSDIVVSTSNTSGTFSKADDIITITFTSSESVNTPTVTINGVGATLSGGPTTWTATHTLGAAETERLIPYTITATDIAGNQSLMVSEISGIYFDRTPPVISSATVPAGEYKLGDSFDVTITANDDIYDEYAVSVNGKGALTFNNQNNNQYKVTYNVEAADNQQNAVNTLPVSLQLEDFAGNFNNPAFTTATVDGGTLTIDTQLPVIGSVTSDAEGTDNLLIDSTILFTVTLSSTPETGLIVNPQEYNGVPLVWAPNGTGSIYTATYKVEPGHTDCPVPAQLGDVTLTDGVGNVSVAVPYNSVNRSIYATRPSAEILGTTTKCDDGTTVPITFSLTGATPFQLTYNNGTSTVGPIEVNDVTYVVNAESGTFTLVNLTDVNGNYTTTATQNATITVNPLPPLTFDVTSSPFNKDQTKVDLSLYVSDLPAHFSGYGVGADGWFYPQIIDPNDYDSPIPITYTYTDGNGCTNSIDDDVVVTSGGARIDDLESSYCNYADPFTITGFNPIGTTGWFEFESENTPGNSLTIDPSSLIAGNHTVVYKYIDGTSTFQAQKSFAVDSVGVNTNFITLLTKYCEDADDVSLTAIDYYPSGGTGHFSFSGPSEAFTPSVINSNIALFEPSKAPVNQTYQVSYYYTSPAGCESNLIQKSVTINPTPDVDFIIRDNYNFDEGDVQLEGDPTGGTFSSGTVIHNNGILKPSLFTPGDLYIKYAYTNQTTGCSNSIEKPTRIIKADEVISGLEEKYCYSTDTVLMECTPIVDGTIVGEFYSDRLGLIESYEPNKAKYPIAAIGNGEDVVRYRYSVVGTPYEVYTEVLVDSIGEVTIQNLLEGYCEDAAKIQISGFSSHGSGGGAFSYSGTSIAFEPDGDFANLRPTEENVGIYEVTYEYTSDLSNCKSDTTVQVEIYPLPEVSFELPTYYNIDDPNITLVGEPSGGIFSTATGVIANEFRPADFGVGPVTITYTYSDGNSCENSISKTVTIIGPSATITGLPATICIDGESINISGSSTNGLPGYFEGPGITNTEANKANFNPAEAGEGEHNIFYKYTSSADGTTLLYISQIIEVIDLGEVSILGFRPSMEYCKGEDVVSLTGTPQPGTFSGSGIVGNEFYPSVANVGTNEIVYTHTLSGCSISGSVQVTINPLPEVSIDVVQVCSNLNDEPIEFINNTTSIDEVVSWHWSFGAGEGTSEEFEPDYLYKTPGSKLVSLEAETVKGCSATGTKVINVGILPEANFSWVNECINGSATEFTSTSDGGVNIEHLTWFVDGVELTEVSDSLEFGHEFLEVGDYTVKLLVESEDGCKDSIEKVLHIQPLIAISELSNQIYFEDFEDNESYWSAGPVDENEENQLYSWAFGTPTGSINQPELGANTWFIGVNDADQFAEHSQLISPCYDLRSLTKPMIKFNLWSANEVGRNGTVLQYTIDNGLTWNIIGDVNTGINWYNSNSIKSQPGYQLTGWSINTDDWVSARHSLDMVREAENVRFRIAFAADGNSTVDFYGFGIDDIWIGNREQKLLLEYFTNATTSATVSANSTMRSIETSNYRDIAAIHYHTSSPVGDPFYSFYPAGPSSRELFYGVSQIPYALVNGDTENSFASANLSSIQPMLNIEMLKDPRMKIEVEGSVGTSVNLQATITMLDDFADEDLVLYCAIVQKIADVATPLNGQDEFYSVLRGFVPDPGGTLLKQNWESGESEIFTMSTTIPEGIPTEMLRAMVFVQNIEDGKIYQTEIFDASPSTSTNPNAENFAVSVYPNPARSLVRFSAPQIIEQATLVDISGRILDVLEPNSDRFEIPVDRLVNGIYFVRVKAKTGQAVVKFIKE